MPDGVIAASTADMRAKVPELGQASTIASRIGSTLNGALASNEPLAEWTHDEVTAQYLPVHQQIKQFVGQVFELLPDAVGGDQERTRALIDLLEQAEENSTEDAEQAMSLIVHT
ncbi:hypothetical protein OHA72_37080 [Dactylosporangium sp. NBC_01737]|uniref:hypothetical protein n=1 Tax=Dactylosporangium sp. NBC_01737 TaxID=2975959 RepID=UPI002E10A768|nr:hypothetical protein OHA72_37080 [Dactylosporangium sp. NBC_01737]